MLALPIARVRLCPETARMAPPGSAGALSRHPSRPSLPTHRHRFPVFSKPRWLRFATAHDGGLSKLASFGRGAGALDLGARTLSESEHFSRLSQTPVASFRNGACCRTFEIGFDSSRSRVVRSDGWDVVGIGVVFQASPNPGGFVSLCATGSASVRGPPGTGRASGTQGRPPAAMSGSHCLSVPWDRDVVGIGVVFQASPNPGGFVSQPRVVTDFRN